MDLFLPLRFLIGLGLILGAAQVLVSVTKAFAVKIKLSPLFIALVVVALGTNIPELTVLVTSISKVDPGLSLGNLVGSSIANISLIFGIAILVGSPKIGTTKTPKNALVMLSIVFLFLITGWMGINHVTQGLILLTSSFLVLFYQYRSSVNGRLHEDKYSIQRSKKLNKRNFYLRQPVANQLLLLAISVATLSLGGQLVVDASRELSEVLSISTTVIGLTLLAVSTTLPELVTILVASIRDEDKILVGTIIGSNIYNLGFFTGILALNGPINLLSPLDTIFLAMSTLMFTWLVIFNRGKKIAWWVGGLFLLIFSSFVFQALIF